MAAVTAAMGLPTDGVGLNPEVLSPEAAGMAEGPLAQGQMAGAGDIPPDVLLQLLMGMGGM
jgi:hypothetical protein